MIATAPPDTAAVVVTSTSPLWYTTRATGLIALILITFSVVLGLLTSVRFARPNWPRLVTVGLHRNMSLLVLVFTGLHILTTVTDSYAHINLLAIVVPFASSYRPIWLGLGAVAFDLLIAVTITSLLRVHVGHRLWRLVHWLAYVCWPAAITHSLGTGTDTPQRWVLAITACCVTAVVAAAAWRLAAGWRERAGTRIALAGVVAVALVAGTDGWLAVLSNLAGHAAPARRPAFSPRPRARPQPPSPPEPRAAGPPPPSCLPRRSPPPCPGRCRSAQTRAAATRWSVSRPPRRPPAAVSVPRSALSSRARATATEG